LKRSRFQRLIKFDSKGPTQLSQFLFLAVKNNRASSSWEDGLENDGAAVTIGVGGAVAPDEEGKATTLPGTVVVNG
jgi:hypothetical protein